MVQGAIYAAFCYKLDIHSVWWQGNPMESPGGSVKYVTFSVEFSRENGGNYWVPI